MFWLSCLGYAPLAQEILTLQTESENFISFSSETTSFLPSKELANPNIDNDLNKSNEVVVEKTVDIDYEDDANNVDEEINIDKRFDFIEDEDDDDLGTYLLYPKV